MKGFSSKSLRWRCASDMLGSEHLGRLTRQSRDPNGHWLRGGSQAKQKTDLRQPREPTGLTTKSSPWTDGTNISWGLYPLRSSHHDRKSSNISIWIFGNWSSERAGNLSKATQLSRHGVEPDQHGSGVEYRPMSQEVTM